MNKIKKELQSLKSRSTSSIRRKSRYNNKKATKNVGQVGTDGLNESMVNTNATDRQTLVNK